MAGPSARSFRRHHQWCWNIEPEIPVTGQVYDEVQVDGIYLRSGWCALIAIAGGRVIGWQWCDREKRAAWAAFLARFPAPRVVLWLRAERWPTAQAAAAVLDGALAVLGIAHEMSLVHRDVSPANILLQGVVPGEAPPPGWRYARGVHVTVLTGAPEPVPSGT